MPSSVAQWQSNRLLTGRLLVRVQPEELGMPCGNLCVRPRAPARALGISTLRHVATPRKPEAGPALYSAEKRHNFPNRQLS